jgi:hypothetical protein
VKIHLKDQTEKMKEENVKTRLTKKSNIEKTVMRGQSVVDMHGTWHPIPFNEDGNGMVGYKFGVT